MQDIVGNILIRIGKYRKLSLIAFPCALFADAKAEIVGIPNHPEAFSLEAGTVVCRLLQMVRIDQDNPVCIGRSGLLIDIVAKHLSCLQPYQQVQAKLRKDSVSFTKRLLQHRFFIFQLFDP